MGFPSAVWATFTGKGVYSEGQIARAEILHDDPDTRWWPTGQNLPRIPNVLYTARAILGDSVVMRRVVKTVYMPWDNFPLGETMPTSKILGHIGEEGYPGFDAPIRGIDIWRGTGRWGRPVYAIVPDCGKYINAGYIEVSPCEKQPI